MAGGSSWSVIIFSSASRRPSENMDLKWDDRADSMHRCRGCSSLSSPSFPKRKVTSEKALFPSNRENRLTKSSGWFSYTKSDPNYYIREFSKSSFPFLGFVPPPAPAVDLAWDSSHLYTKSFNPNFSANEKSFVMCPPETKMIRCP